MSQAITNAFNEWNRQLIDQQQWNERHAAQAEDSKDRMAMREESAKDRVIQREQMQLGLQNARQQNELNGYKVAEQREYNTPKPFSIYEVAGRDWAETPEGQEDMLNVYRKFGATSISAADGVPMVGDQPLQLTGPQRGSVAGMVQFVRQANTDTPTKIMNRQSELQDEYEDLAKNYKKNSGDYHTRMLVNDDVARMKEIEGELKRADAALQPQALVNFYDRKASAFEAGALTYSGIGQQKAADYLMKQAATARGLQANLLTSMTKANAKTYKPERLNVYNNDTKDPNYRGVITTIQHIPGTPLPEIGPNQSFEQGPELDKMGTGKGAGTGLGSGKGELTFNNLYDNVRSHYKTAIPGGFIGNVVRKEFVGKIETTVAIAKKIGEQRTKDGNFTGYATGMVDALAAVTKSERIYWDNHARVDEWREKGVPQKDPKTGDIIINPKTKKPETISILEHTDKMMKTNKAFNTWVKNSGEPITIDNVSRVLKLWADGMWKMGMMQDYGIDFDSIYEPNEFTRNLKKVD